MRILIVHNDYGVYSGEEAVVDRMIADGRSRGHEIETLRRTSKHARDRFSGKVHAFFSGIWSISGRRMMRKALKSFRPDIVHIHNLYPFISPAVLFLCKKQGVPVVMTVHNYRLICPTGLFLREGRPCEKCLHNGNEWACIRHNCEHSLFRSTAYALRNGVARRSGAYKDCVDYYCCLTEFQKKKLTEAGFDKEKIRVFPNYIDPQPSIEPGKNEESYIGYVGRLSEEKGYDLLMEVARRHPEIPVRFAGRPRTDMPTDIPSNVVFTGMLGKNEIQHFYRQCRFIVIPSRCYEGFPVVLLEAFQSGKPCIASNHGAFPDLMTDKETGVLCGRLFTPLDVDDLEQQVVSLWNNPEELERLGKAAFEHERRHFQKETLNEEWEQFLQQVIAEHK